MLTRSGHIHSHKPPRSPDALHLPQYHRFFPKAHHLFRVDQGKPRLVQISSPSLRGFSQPLTPTRCQCREALLPAASEGSALCAASDRDRQVAELRRRSASTASQCRAPTKPLPQQSGREFTSTNSASGTADAALQTVSAGPALPVGACVHLRTLPSTTPSNDGRPLPGLACHRIQGLAAGDVCQSGGIITPWVLVLGSNATVSG